ncbi:uncharacterized protein [Argopecten irradians]|uniref:uncharacterized protein n=1 Tax=Argopecten irradians TaxID=31199 RepID=UPI00371425D9
MATSKLGLNDFCKSEEEEIVQSVFNNIIRDCNGILPAFLNLVIDCSNAKSGKSFSDAHVDLKLGCECREAYSLDYIKGCPECGCVYTKDILALDIMKEFLKDGVDAIEKYPTATSRSFLSLFEFLRDKRKHEEAIQKLAKDTRINGSKETQIMVGFAHHLFSQLIPGKKYEVNEYAKQLPDKCGCGCMATISKGDTSVGSERTWHGRFDIILNNTIAVTLGNGETKDSDNEDDECHDTNLEPARKQRKVETESTCDICDEVRANNKHDSVLLESKVVEQIIAEAITNGFAQVNRNENTLSHFLIPTIAATVDHVCICLYDPLYDCLLLAEEWMKLWIPQKDILDHKTIVVVWLFLNFTVFTETKMAAKHNLDISGLHAQLQNHLVYYREVETRKQFNSPVVPWSFAKSYKASVCE